MIPLTPWRVAIDKDAADIVTRWGTAIAFNPGSESREVAIIPDDTRQLIILPAARIWFEAMA